VGGVYTPNNIYNVDAYKAIKEIPNASIDCIYVDVPYLIGENTKKEEKNTRSEVCNRINKMANSLIENNIYSGFDYGILEEFIRISKKVNIFIWCSKAQIPYIMNFFILRNDYTYEILVWNKTNPTPMCNNIWLPDLEYCLYFREKGVILNDGYENKSKWFISGLNVKDKELFEHPTIKPLEMVKRHLKHATQPNDIVLDCFMGSGTTAVACKELGRNYIGFEINPKYYQIAIDRINGITQKDRKLKEQGQLDLFDYLNIKETE
jgi:DNA modification methylase